MRLEVVQKLKVCFDVCPWPRNHGIELKTGRVTNKIPVKGLMQRRSCLFGSNLRGWVALFNFRTQIPVLNSSEWLNAMVAAKMKTALLRRLAMARKFVEHFDLFLHNVISFRYPSPSSAYAALDNWGESSRLFTWDAPQYFSLSYFRIPIKYWRVACAQCWSGVCNQHCRSCSISVAICF